jgi:hypothetical protein
MGNFITTSFFIAACMLTFVGCKKDALPKTNTNTDATLESEVLTDFSNKLVNPN